MLKINNTNIKIFFTYILPFRQLFVLFLPLTTVHLYCDIYLDRLLFDPILLTFQIELPIHLKVQKFFYKIKLCIEFLSVYIS